MALYEWCSRCKKMFSLEDEGNKSSAPPTCSAAQDKAEALIQRGRATVLLTAIEEAIARLKSGMTHGALTTLEDALRDDKDFHKPPNDGDHAHERSAAK